MISDPKIQPPPQGRFATRPRAGPRGDAASRFRRSRWPAEPRRGLLAGRRVTAAEAPPRCACRTMRPTTRRARAVAHRGANCPTVFPLMLCHNRVSPMRADIFATKQISRTKAARPPGNENSPSWFCRLPAVPGQARARLAWRGAANYEAPLQGRPNA